MVTKEGRDVCRVWHAELVFFVVVGLVVTCTVTADAKADQRLQGLRTFNRPISNNLPSETK